MEVAASAEVEEDGAGVRAQARAVAGVVVPVARPIDLSRAVALVQVRLLGQPQLEP